MVFLPFKDIFRHKRMKAFGGSRGSAMAMPEKNIGLFVRETADSCGNSLDCNCALQGRYRESRIWTID
jgi:hypothetical protein